MFWFNLWSEPDAQDLYKIHKVERNIKWLDLWIVYD